MKILRNWAKAHGTACRQRMNGSLRDHYGKHRTLPEYMYQRCNIVIEHVDVFSDKYPNITDDTDVSEERVDEESVEEENLDEVDEFDFSSDEEEDGKGLELANHNEIRKSQTFKLVHVHNMEGPLDSTIGCCFRYMCFHDQGSPTVSLFWHNLLKVNPADDAKI